jgi:hypothetical protein
MYKLAILTYRVQSESTPEQWYSVYYFHDGSYQCTCLGFAHHNHCKHIDAVKYERDNEDD